MDTKKPENTENNKLRKDYSFSANEATKTKSNTTALVVMLILLLIAVGWVGYLYYEKSQHLEQQQEINQVLEEQKSELQEQLEGMIVQYDSLKTNNDSINLLLETEQNKIQRLLSINASNAAKIKLYKNEMQTLRDIMKSYIVQIDSLNRKNQELTAENIEVRQALRKEKENVEQLASEKQQLHSTVQKASVLSAKNIMAEPLNNRSRPKDKVNKVEKVRTCFTVRENAIVKAGPIDVFMQIIRPDGIIITSEDNYFEADGKQMVFSAKRTLEYENQDINMCIYWDNDGSLIEGNYTVNLFAQGNLIGSSGFLLK